MVCLGKALALPLLRDVETVFSNNETTITFFVWISTVLFIKDFVCWIIDKKSEETLN